MIDSQDYADTKSVLKWSFFVIGCIIAAFVVVQFVLSAPAKIVQSYEWFHAAHKQHLANVQNIKVSTIDPKVSESEKYRQRVELNGLKMNCTNLVAEYNRKASQITTEWAQGSSLPKFLSPQDCQ